MSHLLMRRADLNDLPALPLLPPGYLLRDYRPEDITALAAIMQTGFADAQWTPDRLRRVLVEATEPKRIFIADYAGQPVASASARMRSELHPGSGYIHWVATAPSHRGQGLGLLVTLACLYAFRDYGLRDAVLETDDHRLPAIRIYQRLGFVPEARDASHIDRWAVVLSNLLTHAR